MELRHLRYFVAVAEDLHFGRAANRLNTSQSSLSQQIRNLEKELKVDLLRRVKRHVELTPAGSRFLREARGILAAAERAAGLARETAREESRKFAIGISPETDWAFLGKALRLFGEHAPSVEILFQNLPPEAQIEGLRAGRIDIGFVGLPVEAEGIVSEVTGRERLVAAIPQAHPMARSPRIRLRDLSGEAYTLWPRHLSPGRYDQLSVDLPESRVRASHRDGRRPALDPDRPGNGRRRPDRRARRSGDQAESGAGSRLPADRRSGRVHRIRRDLPARGPVAAARFLPPRSQADASPARRARDRRRARAASGVEAARRPGPGSTDSLTPPARKEKRRESPPGASEHRSLRES